MMAAAMVITTVTTPTEIQTSAAAIKAVGPIDKDDNFLYIPKSILLFVVGFCRAGANPAARNGQGAP